MSPVFETMLGTLMATTMADVQRRIGRPIMIPSPVYNYRGRLNRISDRSVKKRQPTPVVPGFFLISVNRRLLCAVHPVARIAQSRHYIAFLVQMTVDRGSIDMHVRVEIVEVLDAFRRSQQT